MLVHQNLMFMITRNCQLAHIITVFRIPETTAIICEPTIKNSVNELINMVMVYGISWTHLPSSSNCQNLLKNKHVLKNSNKACMQNYKIAHWKPVQITCCQWKSGMTFSLSMFYWTVAIKAREKYYIYPF